MLLLQRKGQTAPFTLLTLILLFGRKKTEQEDRSTAEPIKSEPFPTPEILKKTITSNDVSRSRDRLRLASLERDIIGDALTKIYEAESRGQISDSEKNQLLQRYKTDLKRVDGEIDTHKRTVDLYELESAKEDLLKSFQEKMLEIDLKISQIRPTIDTASETTPKPTEPLKTDTNPVPLATNTPKERPSKEKPKNKAEERLESIREEVLKAMERLEQIETEG
jgi:methionyl-tRNA formyltransferase